MGELGVKMMGKDEIASPPKAARNDKEDRLFVSLRVTEKDNTPYQPPLGKGRF
jgi:hypothetical protein